MMLSENGMRKHQHEQPNSTKYLHSKERERRRRKES
jgi:hypothetical protein